MDRKGGGKPMSEYRAIYKCRLCGESFVDYVHAKDEDAAAKKVIDFSLVYGGAHVSRLKVPRNFQVHSCNDGSYGIADFQGMKKGGSENGSPR